jgi:hypothetical protein
MTASITRIAKDTNELTRQTQETIAYQTSLLALCHSLFSGSLCYRYITPGGGDEGDSVL